MKNYEEKIGKLKVEFQKHRDQSPGTISLYKRSSNLFRPRVEVNHKNQIDLKNFNKVIHVDPQSLIAEVEGLTTYEDLVKETLKHSCLPAVVPELKSITIGGAISGCGIESSSFRYGLVHETIKEMDVLLGDGSIVTCTPYNEYKDLFYAFPNSYGTLGYALRVKVQLIPVKNFVKLTHRKFSDSKAYFMELERLCRENREKGFIQYIDGVIFDESEMSITAGEFVDEAPYISNYHYMDIYYRSIQNKNEDYLSTLDYIWRWDADWFWCSKQFGMQNSVLRLLFGKFMLNSSVYKSIMHFFYRHPLLGKCINPFSGNTETIIQDVLIPINKAGLYLDFFQREIGIKPIWICPAHSYSEKNPYSLCTLDSGMLYIDFGFWDYVKTDKPPGYYNRKIEKEAVDLSGFKSLYSSSYYTEEEFWSLYNRPLYTQLKQKYDPNELLGNLYQKCVRYTSH